MAHIRPNGRELESYQLLAAAPDFRDRFMATVDYSRLFKGVYAINSRIKSMARLQDKIDTRHRNGRPEYTLADVTDIVGIRFISLYRRDVTRNVRSILDLLVGHPEVSPNALQELRLIEFKSFTSNTIPDQDPLNLELRALYEGDYMARVGAVKLELIPLGRYSSVHMVLKARIQHDGRDFVMPIELQFRSVFEDAWAEIEHKLLYEVGRYGERVDEAQRDTMTQHMNVLKKMVDTAAEYADVIRRTIIITREKPVTIERNLDGAEYIRELAPRAGLAAALTDDLALILSEKVGLDTQIETGRQEGSAVQYADIANRLRVMLPAVEAALAGGVTPATRTILFSIRMEEALCRLLSGDPQQIRASVESYSALTQDYPDFPAGWFRSAQAHQRLTDLSDTCDAAVAEMVAIAFDHFGRAVDHLDACRKLQPDDRVLLISPQQEAYIEANAGRLRGFVKWRLSDRRRRERGIETNEDLADVLDAYAVSKAALARDQGEGERMKLVNNLAYFAADAHRLAVALDTVEGLPEKQELREHLAQLRMDDAGILRLDTIMTGSLVVGDKALAVDAARRILDLNVDEAKARGDGMSSPYVSEASGRAVRNAWLVVRDA